MLRKLPSSRIYPNTISSDIYCKNRIKGPVYSLAYVMSKFLLVGLSLSQVIDCVTKNAAHALRLSNKGRLEVGCDADFTIFDVVDQAQVSPIQNNKTGVGKT